MVGGLLFVSLFLRDHFSEKIYYFLIYLLIQLEKLSTCWHQTPPSGFRLFGERGEIFTERIAKNKRISNIFQCHKSYHSFVKMEEISHRSILNGTFFISGP